LVNRTRKKILFLDWRDIACGRLDWLNRAGERYGVGNPPGEPVEMHARPTGVPHGIRLAAQPARTSGPMANYAGWGKIIREDGRYRTWYLRVDGHSKLGTGSAAHRSATPTVEICRAESADGFHWSDPACCRIEVPGQTGFDGTTFFVDPAAAPAERYKFIYCALVPGGAHEDLFAEYRARHPRHQDERLVAGGRSGMYAAVSPDGLAWTAVPRPIMLHASDTDTTVFRDEAMGAYVMYTRLFRDERRWIGRAEADDFHRWGPVEPIVWPRLDDPPDHDYYLNGHTLYPGLAEYRLMFPMIYERFTERSRILLYSSADGLAWSRVPGGPVILPGGAGSWDSEFICGGRDLVPFGTGRIAIPYTGTPYPHKYPRWTEVWKSMSMGWAAWEEDRLCSVTTDREGEFATIPSVPAGRKLVLNFRTLRAGDIRVGVEGVTGRSTADCDPLHGDCAAQVVTWGGHADIGATPEAPVSLQFRLRSAELFSIAWR
jgi:hypothetical protein